LHIVWGKEVGRKETKRRREERGEGRERSGASGIKAGVERINLNSDSYDREGEVVVLVVGAYALTGLVGVVVAAYRANGRVKGVV
jgi:hypothetical protein